MLAPHILQYAQYFALNNLVIYIEFSSSFSSTYTPVAQRIAESGFDMKKAAFAAIPVAAIATPAFAMDSIIEALPTQTLALEVQFGAYLAVLLGTLLPVLFLINLYVQTESRKAGRGGGQDAE
jgi:photosystem II PsbM protein